MIKKILLVVFIYLFSCTKISGLDSININNEALSPPFDVNIKEYNYYTNDNNIKISVSKKKNEIVKGYGYFDVLDGHNEFYVSSFNNDVESRYKINVYKNYISESKNVITFKSLNIENYDIDFKNDVFEYYIDLKEDNYLNINYELDNPNSIVEIKNNGNFLNENNDVIIEIREEESNNSNKYTIHVNKTLKVFKSNEEIKELSFIEKNVIKIIIIVVSCSLAVFMFYIIFKNRYFLYK